MSSFFPRVAFGPAHLGPVHNDFAPFFNLLDDTFSHVDRAQRHHNQSRQWAPRFDVREEKDAYQLEGELPGLEQKDIQIEFTDEHTLVIKGRTERRVESGTPPSTQGRIEEAEKPAAQDDRHQPTVEDDDASTKEKSAATGESSSTAVATQSQSKDVAKAPEQQPKSRVWISERSVGEFQRSFSFPARVDQDGVKASLKNGILSIVVPKAHAPQSRRINVE